MMTASATQQQTKCQQQGDLFRSTNRPNVSRYPEFVATLAANELHGDLVPPGLLRHTIVMALLGGQGLDEAKKALFYGKDTWRLSGLRFEMGMEREDSEEVYDPSGRDLVHALLGIRTEADELLTLLLDGLDETKADDAILDRIMDELGDLMWYSQLAMQALDVTLYDVILQNMIKLKARYPEGFSEDRAVNRNIKE